MLAAFDHLFHLSHDKENEQSTKSPATLAGKFTCEASGQFWLDVDLEIRSTSNGRVFMGSAANACWKQCRHCPIVSGVFSASCTVY